MSSKKTDLSLQFLMRSIWSFPDRDLCHLDVSLTTYPARERSCQRNDPGVSARPSVRYRLNARFPQFARNPQIKMNVKVKMITHYNVDRQRTSSEIGSFS